MRIMDGSSDVCSSDLVLSGRLTRIEAFMGEVSESPAMRLTPANLAVSIERASETARAGDRDIIETASAVLRASIARIDGVVAQAWAAERPLKDRKSVAEGKGVSVRVDLGGRRLIK